MGSKEDWLSLSLDDMIASEKKSGTFKSASGRSRGGGGGRAPKGDRVYVGNLSWDTSWQNLKDHMRAAGEVNFCDVMRSPDGQSKGCGLVEFASKEEAENAIESLHDTKLDGRQIFVREDRGGPGAIGKINDRGGGFRSPPRKRERERERDRPRRGAGGGSKVYVGNLSFDTAWQELKDHMRGQHDQFEITRADVAGDGSGVVEYSSAQVARKAINALQETVLDGRSIALSDTGSNNSSFNGNRGSGGSNKRVYVGNLPWSVSWQGLKDHFKSVGNVAHADVMQTPDGKSKGCGLVEFQNARDAKRAIAELNDTEFEGRPIFVREDREAY